MNSPVAPKRLPGFGLLLLMLIAAAIAWGATRQSVGLGGDSVNYISEARTGRETGTMQVFTGSGDLVVTSQWPPLYPALLWALSYVTGDALSAARWLNVLLFPLNCLLTTLLAWRATRSGWGALAVGLVFLLAPCILEAHAMAMSESLCLFGWMLSLWLLLLYQEKGTKLLLAGAALAAAASLLTRYAAAPQIAAGAVFLILYSPRNLRQRLADAVGFAVIALLPMAAYLLWHRHFLTSVNGGGVANALRYQGELGNRAWGFYGIPFKQWRTSLFVWESWVCPVLEWPLVVRGPLVMLVGAGLAGLVLLLVKYRQAGAPPPISLRRGLVVLLLANFILYVGFLLFTGMFIDRGLDMGSRMHVPSFAFLLIIVGALISSVPTPYLPSHLRPWLIRGGTALLGVYLCLSVIAGFLWLREADDLHLGLGNTQWRESPAAALIRKLPAAAPIYSNQVWYVYFVTGRTNLFGLPNVNVDAARGIANENYAKEMDAMLQSIAAHHGSIVVFTADQPTLKNSVSAAQLKNNSALRVSAQTPDAVIFTAASP